MNLSVSDIQQLERKYRLNLINSITGVKPANLIGTINSDGLSNLAIFSSVVHLGSDPALVGFITRPTDEVPRNTYDNILENSFFTVNHVPASHIKNAHYTSTKFPSNVSEFEKCGFTEEYIDGFKAPYVKEATIKFGVKFCQQLPIELNETRLMIGQIQHIIAPDDAVNDKGYLDLESKVMWGSVV
ncbi:flavin reductase family protein [Kangiella marina]|uniref:Flavin reductase n=1 Tax=Kangiella marina TaxID=1079178 RepID=A0ABP8ICK5_9GAMM